MHTVHFILEENAVGLFLRNAENSKRWSEEPHLILYRSRELMHICYISVWAFFQKTSSPTRPRVFASPI